MAKNKNSASRQVRYPVELPYVVDMDTLSYASDDELKERNYYLNDSRDRVIRSNLDSTPWDVELAYVQREMSIRDARRAAHDKYVRSNPDLFIQDSQQFDTDQEYN